jgi:MFS family permease
VAVERTVEKVVPLAPFRRSQLWTLGLGAFGLAFSITTTAAYLPPLLGQFTESRTLIALVLGAEGVFAIALPLVVGPWSDTFHTPLGRRRPFMLVALGPIGFCLSLIAFMPNLWTTALLVFAFFFAYYLYEPPYRGLYPDVLPESVYGRSQSVQHILRGIALGVALVGGGALFNAWEAAPFLVAAVVTTAACGATIIFTREKGGHERVFKGVRSYLSTSMCLLREEPNVRLFLLANSAWEGTFAAMRTFVVLYIIKGLDQPLSVSSAVLATVAAGYVVAAIGSGPIGDRIGLARLMFFASFVYGGGLLVGGFAQQWHDWYYALIFPVAVAGGTVMTLAWGLLFKLMPARHRGGIAGLATMTKGVGLLIGPVVAGAAIDLASPFLDATEGYQVLWPICALPILAAIPLLARLIAIEPRRPTGTAELPVA